MKCGVAQPSRLLVDLTYLPPPPGLDGIEASESALRRGSAGPE